MSIEFVKGIAIFFVITLHVRDFDLWIPKIISTAVPLFFMSTGFLLWLVYRDRFEAKKFLKSRVVRLFPDIYLVGLISVLLCLLFDMNELDGFWRWIYGDIRGFGPGSYYVSCYLLLCVCLVPLLMSFKTKWIVHLSFLYLLSHACLSFYKNEFFYLMFKEFPRWYITISPTQYFPHVLLGILFASLCDRIISHKERIFAVLFFVFLCFILESEGFYNGRFMWNKVDSVPFESWETLYYGILFCFSFFIVLYNLEFYINDKLKRPVIWMGERSYQIFLVQAVYFKWINKVDLPLLNHGLSGFLVSVSVVVLSFIIYNYIYEYLRVISLKFLAVRIS
ncbi:acyltransferase family protein [Desulfovibrio ferrophilus]|uniref:acyltransferase family protein n=1 Tax=Desulfovibrio ferrophilus TaxID=241368 RepID=UPI000F83292B|nr:acyltransferase family protein [Desulfovibrio ferrophilus]